ncbi:putative mitochondrial protein [Glycine max]|nr:putative mitochondrial protein [Glycine max]
MYINIKRKKIAWVSWTQCCASRDAGGLGIKDFRILNNSLLIKWKWYMFHQPEQLWNRILIYKYQGWRGLDQGPQCLGRGIKWAAIKKLNLKYKVDLGDSNVSWDNVPSVHTYGGLLCLWNNSVFEVDSRVKGSNFLMLAGRWIKDDQRIYIVNIYAPCDLQGKRALWEELRQLRISHTDGLWCFLGDFNSIRSQEERIGTSQRMGNSSDISEFNNWIFDMELQEIKSYGSRFTWFRPNGSDRCLVSEQWLSHWPDSSQHVIPRDFSDHCPILLKTDMVDWGPKPFRVLDWWLKNKEYQTLVKESWTGDQQAGWGGFVLKKKLRNLKSSLKQWSREFGDAMLRGFELASGLKINFAKSQVEIFGAEMHDTSCPLCGNAQEEVDHLFFNCEMTLGLWWESMSWNQMVGPIASSPAAHFIQFCEGYAIGQNQSHRYGWWVALTNSIWKHRNQVVFEGNHFQPSKVMDDALFLNWSWLKTREKHFSFSFNQWSSNLAEGETTIKPWVKTTNA